MKTYLVELWGFVEARNEEEAKEKGIKTLCQDQQGELKVSEA